MCESIGHRPLRGRCPKGKSKTKRDFIYKRLVKEKKKDDGKRGNRELKTKETNRKKKLDEKEMKKKTRKRSREVFGSIRR